MLRTLFILLLILLGSIGLYWVFFGGAKGESMSYEQYLQGALERNSPDTQRYTVMIDVYEFFDTETSLSENSQNTLNDNKNTGEINTSVGNNNLIAQSLGGDRESSSSGNFGTPNIVQSGDIFLNEDCEGLIFDPCIIPPMWPDGRGGGKRLNLKASTPNL